MLHHDLRFELFVDFKRDRDHDQQACCRERVCKRKCRTRPRAVADCKCTEQERRDERNKHKEHSAEERHSVVDLLQEVAGRFARSDTGNKSAVLLNVSCNVVRIELNHCVEIAESENEHCKEHIVYRRTRSHVCFVPCRRFGVCRKELDDHLREHEQRRCENYRHNAASADANGDVGGLTAVHFVALDLFGVLHGHSSLCAVHEHDEHEDRDDDKDKSENVPDISPVGADHLERVCHRRTCGRNDTDKDDDGSAVADAVFGDSFAQPHDHDAACRQKNYRESHRENCVVLTAFKREDRADVRFESDHDTDCLNDCKHNRDYSRDLRKFLSAFIAFFGQSFECGNDQCKQLHDN